jgi:hypothetical protein
MKMHDASKFGPGDDVHTCNRDYLGHVLERAMEIIDGESRTPWVGWRCVHCGDRFALPGEVDRYDLPLMERVEVEELPTDDRESQALVLALAASASAAKEKWPFRDALRSSDPESSFPVHMALGDPRCAGLRVTDRYALAESLIRNGEV